MEESIQFLIENEVVFKHLYQKYGVPFIPYRKPGFETLCKLIIEQQVSLASAKACFQKLELFLGKITPQSILSVSLEELRNNGLSKQKANYLHNLSEAVLTKKINLKSLENKNDEAVRSELIQIKGIGNWTIDIYLMFSLESPDILPLGDIAIVNSLKELFTCSNIQEMVEISQKWSPHRSMAAFFLWHHYLESRGRKPLVY